MAKSRISASDFLALIENENQHIKQDINRQSYLGQRYDQVEKNALTPQPRVESTTPLAAPTKASNEAITGKLRTKPEQRSGKSGLTAKVNHEQTVSKVVANHEQTVSKVVANHEQTVSKASPIAVTKTETVSETVSATVSSSVSKVVANRKQTVSKVVANYALSNVVGLQRSVLVLIYNECQATRSEVSPPITLEHLANQCKSTEKTVKNAIYRLTQKTLISRVEFKDGRGGWTKYRLSDSVFQDLLRNETVSKVVANHKQTVSKVVAQPEAQPEASSPIVVVSNSISKNTTTTELEKTDEICFVIPPELSGKVSRRQLTELVTAGKTSETDLQLSLDAFAYDLRHNLISLKHSSNPIGLLIGAIKNNGSYNSAKYIEALKSELKPFVESQRDATLEKTNQRSSKEWGIFQKFKLENQEEYKKLEAKIEKYGLKGPLLEDFTFLEYKKEILKVGEELNLNPLRPAEKTI